MINPRTYFEEIGIWPRGSRIAMAYVTGFILSLLLTFAAYALVVHAVLSARDAIIALLLLACLQFLVQMTCFLHLSKGTISRDRLIVFCCAGVVVLILISGSLWIMLSLNARMMPSTTQMEQYMNVQTGI
jgi:cytochrome o ubiquinol oxidase operon protein cyoD